MTTKPDDTVEVPKASTLPADKRTGERGEKVEGDPRLARYRTPDVEIPPVDPAKEPPVPSQAEADAIKEGVGGGTKEEREARRAEDEKRAKARRERDERRRDYGPRPMPAGAGYETR